MSGTSRRSPNDGLRPPRTSHDSSLFSLPLPLPFAGRDDEVALLNEMMRQARDGSGAATHLTGESGVGKSALLREIANHATADGWQVATGRAFELDATRPYAIIADALAPILRSTDAATLALLNRGAADELSNILPSLPRGRSAGTDGSSAEDSRTRTLWQFSQFLQRLAERQPLLITLDNLHWADAASLELLAFAARQLSGTRVAIVAASTEPMETLDAGTARALRGFTQTPGVRQLRLAPLTFNGVCALVTRTFQADAPGVPDFARRLHGHTMGNAFFIEQVLQLLVERGDVRHTGEGWAGWESDVSVVPASVRDFVLASLERLSDEAQQVAGLMSVVGSRIALPLLERLVPDGGLLADTLQELERRGTLCPPSDHREPAYQFQHPIVRSVLYQRLGPVRARLHHRRVFEALEAMYGSAATEHAGELAPHLMQAGEQIPAARRIVYLAAAGRDALNRRADVEAERFLTAAVATVDAVDDEGHRLHLSTLLPLLARANQRLGAHDAARNVLRRADAVSQALGRPEQRASII